MFALGVFALLATMTFCFSSCEPKEPENQVKVVNETGSLTLRSFTFKFFSATGEILRSTDVGTFNPGETKTMDIPTGTASWRVGAYINDDWNFAISPEYTISTKTLKLTYGDVHDGWQYNNDRF